MSYKSEKITLFDLPNNEPNCSTCTYRGELCMRVRNKSPYYKKPNGEIVGVIVGCLNYQGRCKYDRQLKIKF